MLHRAAVRTDSGLWTSDVGRCAPASKPGALTARTSGRSQDRSFHTHPCRAPTRWGARKSRWESLCTATRYRAETGTSTAGAQRQFGTIYSTNITPDASTGIGGLVAGGIPARHARGPRQEGPASLSGLLLRALHQDHRRGPSSDLRVPHDARTRRLRGTGQRASLPRQHPHAPRGVEAPLPRDGGVRRRRKPGRRMEPRCESRRRPRALRRLSHPPQPARGAHRRSRL